MITSLANFRSDYTVVHVPDGNFPAHRDRLFANINLLRMGCSGRTALTLQDPSDATKQRFLSLYHLNQPDNFVAVVLEFVRAIQAALACFQLYPLIPDAQDGLLCDITVEGLQRWVSQIGEPYLNVQPTERVADPTTISALLSLVVTIRNKLCILGYTQAVPRDPFVRPHAFARAVAQFAQIRAVPSSRLDIALIKRLDGACDKEKSRSRVVDPFKVHRVLLNKLDDATNPNVPEDTQIQPTSDLLAFTTKLLHTPKKDTVWSLRELWMGHGEDVKRKRKVLAEAAEEDRTDGKTTEEDTDFLGLPWRMQKKIENWAGSRAKKLSVDLTNKLKAIQNSGSTVVPAVSVSRDPGDALSSGQVSPDPGCASLRIFVCVV